MDERKTAAVFKALCDENRIRILKLLTGGEKCACKLLDELSVTQPTLSHHMKILCDSGIVSGRKEGKWMYYSISEPVSYTHLVPFSVFKNTEQARRGTPLIRMAQAPHLRTMQPHSQLIGFAGLPKASVRGILPFSSLRTAATEASAEPS